MMTLINESYSLIEHAPLRYYVESSPEPPHAQTRIPRSPNRKIDWRTPPPTDRFEFWVRFVCGALFGALISARLYFALYERPTTLTLIAAGLVLGCGLGAARYGDQFWRSVLGRWYWRD